MTIYNTVLWQSRVRKAITVKLSNMRWYIQEINRKTLLGGNYRNTYCIYQGVFLLSCSNHFRKAGAAWGCDAGVAQLLLPGSPTSPLLPSKAANESTRTQVGFAGTAASVVDCPPDQR